ncbi:MAG: rhomboid family GlyGly-CTERM serine protease [Glaciecola sp.]|jgi:rhomboid family GlyGly-CTERM serine protease
MRDYLLYIFLLATIVLLALAEPTSSQWLMFDRNAINEGQIWRLFSAHFVHLSPAHLFGNSLGVVLLAYIAGRSLNNLVGILLLTWCLLVVGVGLYVYADYLQRYVGLSGVLHGLLLVAPFTSTFYSRRIAACFLLVIVSKVVWEQSSFYDDMSMVGLIGGRVEANAHLLGAIAGLSFLLVYYAHFYYLKRFVQSEN